jgi:hypothetical protein
MTTLNYWNATWSLDEAQCPCDVHFVQYLALKRATGAAIFHFGTGNHHYVGLKVAESGANNAVLAITASPEEYGTYIELLISKPRLGFTYKAYFGDIYQIEGRLLPAFDYVTLFHLCEYRTVDNDGYGALTDHEMTMVLADKVKPGGELLLFSGSFAYDRAETIARELVEERPFDFAPDYKSLRILRKRAT